MSHHNEIPKFKEARTLYNFTEYSLHKYLTSFYSKTWLSLHIDSLTAQKIASRAFDAVEKYAYKKRGKPRFKGKGRFHSIEGKNNNSGIRFINGNIVISSKISGTISLTPLYDLKDKHGVESSALISKTKYVRLIRRVIKGKYIWYAQLVQEGSPHVKHVYSKKDKVVGLDIGPSSLAVVSDDYANLQSFCPEIKNYFKKIAEIQKKMSRSLRATNKENFEESTFELNSNKKFIKKLGKVKKGSKVWKRSNKYKVILKRLQELQRTMAATRNCSHGNLVNLILKQGLTIKTEKLNFKSFQKLYGKSIGLRAPGMFLEKLRRKAESAGGEVIEFNTRTTALSQVCQCGSKQKKKLSERWHNCANCGIKAQRDLYSAYLACFVTSDKLDTSQALKSWVGADILLKQAVSNLKQTTKGKSCLASFGLNQRQSGSPVKEGSVISDALNVVV